MFLRDRLSDLTTRMSLTNTEGETTGGTTGSFDASVSGDGTFVAFVSQATNLDAPDTDAEAYIREPGAPASGATIIGSVANDEALPDESANYPALSSDGDFLAFASSATNLAADAEANFLTDIFLRSITGGTTTRISVSDTEAQSLGGGSLRPAIADDGTVVTEVAFESGATNLISPTVDDNGTSDVFVRDLGSASTERVSVTDTEGQVNGFSGFGSISEDGRYVAFYSNGQVTPGVQQFDRGFYVRDRVVGTTQKVDVSFDGTPPQDAGAITSDGTGADLRPVFISDSGRRVAFVSEASNLVPGDSNGTADIFARDLDLGRTVRANVPAGGGQTQLFSRLPVISGDGSVVAFGSKDNGLVPGDTFSGSGYDLFATELDFSLPDTTITAAPPVSGTANQVSASFTGSKSPATFQCRVDGGVFSTCSSPYTTPALAPGAHNIEIRAVDRFGNFDDSAAVTSFVINAPPAGGGGSQQQDQVPPPEYRQTFNLEPVSGQVFVILPDRRRVRIETLTSIPQGSIVDVRRGKVRLLVEEKDGTISSTVWSQGMFKIVQLASGITECRLVGALVEGPTARVSAASARAHAAAKRRRLWGNGTGRFRTKGRFGSATVRGTRWLTEDRRTGTLILVRRGSVKVRDFVRKKTVIVKKGERYFARKRKRR